MIIQTCHDRTRTLYADLFQVCNASYSSMEAQCKGVSAYATAAVFGYDRGMSGADVFAALGAQRVNNMNTVIQDFCGSNGFGYGLGCSYLGNGFHTFAAQYTSVNAGPFTDQFSQVAILDLVDGATTGMARRDLLNENLLELVSFAPGSQGAIKAGEAGESRIAHITPGGIGTGDAVGPAHISNMLGLEKRVGAGLGLDANVNVDLDLDAELGTRSHIGLGANAAANVRLGLDAGLNLGVEKRAKTNVDVSVGGEGSTVVGNYVHTNGNDGQGANIVWGRPGFMPSTIYNRRDAETSKRFPSSTSESEKRTTFTVHNFTISYNDDGSGDDTFSVTSPDLNLTTEAAPGGASYSISLPNSTLQRGSQAGQDAVNSLGFKRNEAPLPVERDDITNELGSISGVAAGGMAGYQLGDMQEIIGDGSSSFGASAATDATLKALQSRTENAVEERQGNLLEALPVGDLLGGLLRRDDLDARQGNLLEALPVGDLLGGLLKKDESSALKRQVYSPMSSGDLKKRHLVYSPPFPLVLKPPLIDSNLIYGLSPAVTRIRTSRPTLSSIV
ncbi:hypothetical protein BD324DRAFT_639307 [Kockovaella imperatae]|uniref:Uncharacterized protein n=1 Tax=Kockovaella imperatae TaxID=4999 RepID=A0A1Y1U6D6_9TREE|nr:hypothetical protein BD324DRAFT_639307 [Kockovaella imperatae]ORX33562.1 hypothetical protein BD324DRAFT_639307 [Kockovaella imperatae]